jgi:hypothetical protein
MKDKQRPLFTDGWNSFWHVFFGVIAVRFSVIIPIFVIYQLIDYKDVNLLIDIIEFFIGFIFSLSLLYGFNKINPVFIDNFFIRI